MPSTPTMDDALMAENEDLRQHISQLERVITTVSHAENDALARQRRFLRALEITKLCYWECDLATQQFTFNDQFYTLYRTDVTQAGGYQVAMDAYIRRYVHPDDVARIGANIDRILASTDPIAFDQVEHRIIRGDGSEGVVLVSFTTERGPQATTTMLYGINQDVTAQKQMEAAMRRSIAQEELLRAQQVALRELSTPLIPLADGLVAMPIIGAIDSARAQQIIEALLEGVTQHRATTAILDITGVKVIDTQIANALVRAAQATKLLGAGVILSGISPEVAQTLVHLGVDLTGIITKRDLQSSIASVLT